MSLQPDQLSAPPVTRLTVLGCALISFLAAYAGPFGTFAEPIWRRAVFWTLVVFAAWFMARHCATLAGRVFKVPQGLPMDLTITALMAALFTPALYFAAHAIFGHQALSGFTYAVFVQNVAIVALIVSISHRLGSGPALTALFRLVGPPAPVMPQPRLAERLPDGFSGQILRLTVEDHLVEVVTDRGSYRIRMRFADAVNEMDVVEGFCTHRSHWVNRSAVSGVVRDSGKLWLELWNGDRVPVSRTHRAELETAGIL